MRQLSFLLQKEILELVRTKRALVLLIVFGVFGMLVAVPSTALLYSLGSELVNKALARRRLQVTTEEVRPLADSGADTGEEA